VSIDAPGANASAVREMASLLEEQLTPAPLEIRQGAGGTATIQLTEPSRRLNLDPADAKNGLGQLVLTLVKLLHELLERQAIRRIDSGDLTEQEVERLGLTLMGQAEEIDRIRQVLGLEELDLNIDLGPLGHLL
jgi:hypothetical protein